MKKTIVLSAIAALTLTGTSNAAWQRIGGMQNRPVDSASDAVEGVEIVSSTGISAAANLLSEDVSLSSRLATGASNSVINLGRQVSIEVVELVNDGVEGRVAIAASTDNKTWQSVGQGIFSAADRTLTVKFSAVQAKYFKLDFDLSKGGSVRCLRMYGSDSDSTIGEGGPDLTCTGSGARVVYIHPSPVRGDELGTKFNRFEFPESDEKYRTVIYDFGKSRTVAEVGSVHSPRPVRMSTYVFEELPETEDWKGRKSFDPSAFDKMTPEAINEDRLGVGYIKARFKAPKSARYVAIRWEPDFNPPSFTVCDVTIDSGSGQKAGPVNTGGGAGAGAGAGQNGTNGTQDGQNGQNGNGNVTAGPGQGVMVSGGSPFSFGAAGGFSGNPGVSNNNSQGAAKGKGKGKGPPSGGGVSP